MDATITDVLNDAIDTNTCVSNLADAICEETYVIKKVDTNDEDMKRFLFTLGCYEGEKITLVSKFKDNFVISVKEARYSIDNNLAKAIELI